VKTLIVLGGYVAAVCAAVIAAWVYDAHVRSLPYDTSGGMYAGGQLMASVAAFLVVALAPTLMGLWFLRRHTKFWNGVAVASVGFAAVGLVAVLVSATWRGAPKSIPLTMVELLGLTHLLGAPFWFAAFVLFALAAPTAEIRGRLSVAVAIEAVVGVFAFVHWFVPTVPS
jgi:hypothetical protein